jgi:16S rRNA (cytosine967-C5)-methyltransferase
MYFQKRIQQAEEVLKTYAYPTPFASHLKAYFQSHKNMGGRDRRELKEVLYCFLRIAKALPSNMNKAEKLSAAYSFFHPGTENSNETKFDAQSIFPAVNELSPEINKEAFIQSHLIQPLTWIHVRKEFQEKVDKELEIAGFAPAKKDELSYGFEPETKLTELQAFKRGWFWIQDHSSQKTADFFNASEGETWWDTCAGAGGKSLAFRERNRGVNLYASDIRPAILENLQGRHQTVFGKKVQTFIADLTRPVKAPQPFDGIIIDAPCTGSGTWARNPEHLLYFNSSCIPDFTRKQLLFFRTHGLT